MDDMAQQYAALEYQRQALNASQQARTVYLVRHGSTALNDEQDCIRGWKNVPLATEGWQEAFDLAKKMKAANVNVGIIFTSDLDRAAGTAQAIGGQFHVPVIKTELLRPWNLGEFTGKPWKQVHEQVVKLAEETPTIAPPGGESFNDFRNRAFNGLRFCLANSRGQPIVLVSHHRVERLFKCAHPDGRPPSMGMFSKGEPPGSVEKLTVSLKEIAGAQPLSVYAGASIIGPDRIETKHEGKQGRGGVPTGS